jgi:hypothetical protein
VAYLEDTLKKLERGDLKLRVRVLESERAFQKIEIVNMNVMNALAACLFLNLSVVLAGGTVLPSVNTATRILLSKLTLSMAGLFGLQVEIVRTYSDVTSRS